MRNRLSTIIFLIILLVSTFLRLWRLSEVPVSLFGDELDVGYQAYSILKTGKDYSGNSWPLHFQSLAEWRTPLYLYSAVPTVAIFGISPLGVRLPAAIFGILGIWGIYLLSNELVKKKFEIWPPARRVSWLGENLEFGILPALVLALSPWHIQYSRGAFEITELLTFLLFGLYFFFKSLKDGKFLWIAGAFLAFCPLIYSTAKLFVPFLMVFLFWMWKKEIFLISKKHLISAIITILIIGLPTVYTTFFGGGTQRFSYLSILTDPTIEGEVGVARLLDARMRGQVGSGINPRLIDRLFHNKFIFWAEKITSNYLQAYSADFLFITGDPNLRHSINGLGQFYKIEVLALILGLILFFTKFNDKRIKILIAFWLIAGVFPSAITRDGGNHASRLILILPPLIFLMAYGIVTGINLLKPNLRNPVIILYFGIWILSFGFYMHNYWVHYPWDSERWWHAGFKDAIQTIKALDKDYDRVIISMSGEPAWIFFAGWYPYPPDKWHNGFPFKKAEVSGFGSVSYIDKYFFGSFTADKGGIYNLPKYLDIKTLYLAVAQEIGANLIREPERVPPGLKLIKPIAYPSGEPAFYLFTRER